MVSASGRQADGTLGLRQGDAFGRSSNSCRPFEIRLRVNEDYGTQMYTTKKPEARAMMILYQINFTHAAPRPT
jgi:hypothetical protein